MNSGIREGDPDVVMEDELEYESDVEADLEVDELDSSGDDQENAAPQPVSTSKKAPAVKPGTRVPGHTLLPQVRIENILNADCVTGNLVLSKEGQFVLSCATEEFIKKFAQEGLEKAKANRQQNMVVYQDMADVAWRNRTFRFLRETVPEPLKLETAWELRGIRMKELMEEDPALGGIIPPGSFHHDLPDDFPEPGGQLPPIVVAGSSSKRKKNGDVNGHSASTAGSSRRTAAANPEIASISTSGTPLGSSSSRGAPKKNGSSASTATLNGHGKQASTALSTPSEDRDDPMLEASEAGDIDDDENMVGDEPQWSGPRAMTGPASAYLQGPGTTGTFARANHDHGRTIYSQQNQPD